MANTRFQHKRSTVSGVSPTTSDIATAELAINVADRKLFTSNGTSVFELGSNLTSVAVGNSSTTQTINSNGIFVNGKIGISNSNPTTNLQIGGNYGVIKVTIASTNNINVNCASGNYFTATANGSATSITFSSVPSNTSFGFVLVLANGGTNTITWSSSPKWPSATAPTVSSNTDVFTFITDDGGTTWRGVQSMKDVR